MHGRVHPQTLPALRRQPPSTEASFSSPNFFTRAQRRGTAPPSDELLRFGSLTSATPPPAAGGTTAAEAGASTQTTSSPAQSYGQPWNTPTTLQSVATAVTQQATGPRAKSPRGAGCVGGGSWKGPAPRALVVPAPPNPPAAVAERGKALDAPLGHGTTVTSMSTTPEATSPEPLADSVVVTSAVRAERLRELEGYVQQRGGRRAALADRHKAIHKALSLLPVVYPALTGIVSTIERYTEDVAAALLRATTEKAEALRQQEKELYEEFEAFFEGKIRELVLARQEAEQQAKAEHAAAFALRQERETELTTVKEELLLRMNACERTEDQFRDFRGLIASVFGTNQQLSMRIEQLEDVLARHRIEVPPGNAEMTAFQTSSDGRAARLQRASVAGVSVSGGAEDEVDGGSGGTDGEGSGAVVRHTNRSKSNQVSMEFIAAAKQELVSSRLTLQEELLHSAFDDRSAYRMRIAGLTQKNLDLNFEVSELEEKVRDLYTYIHEKRFMPAADENGEEMMLMTPRPRDVPLALQTELGIELRHSTANIVAELATVAINMKHQLNSALLRSRQLTTLASWLSEGTEASGRRGGVSGMLEGVTEAAVIPVFPVTAWGTIPHFLRTHVAPDVPNYFWTEAQAACIMHNFFTAFQATRRRARFVRDSKMLSPRVYQLFEHREVLLVRIDALKEDVAASVENVPFGYVVTQFARDVLSNLSPHNVQDGLPLLLPGTVALRFPKSTKAAPSSAAAPTAPADDDAATPAGAPPSRRAEGRTVEVRSPTSPVGDSFTVRDCPWTDAAPVVELELARFTYNMWYAAVRYQTSQPLCKLFVSLVDGQMPTDTFELMTVVAQRVRRRIEQLDVERTRRFGYARLVKGMVRTVADMDAALGLRAVQAVAQAFEANHTPLHGGFLGQVALFADETFCLRESAVASLETEVKQRPMNSAAQRAAAAKAATAAAAAAEAPRTPLPPSIITHQVPLPVSLTATSPPSLLPPLGASRIVHFCRQLVLDTVEGLYSRIEYALCPLVEESEVVLGLYLLSLPRAKAALAALDDVASQEGMHSALMGSGGTTRLHALGRVSASALAGAQLTAEAAEILGVRGVTHGYMNLLESRAGVVEEKRTVERHLTTRMVDQAVRGLPLFKATTHFPFRCDRQAGPAPVEAGAARAGASAGDASGHGDATAATASGGGGGASSGAGGGDVSAAGGKKGGKKGGKRKGAGAAAAATVVVRRNGYLAVQGSSDTKTRQSLSTPRHQVGKNSQNPTDGAADGRDGPARPTTVELEEAMRNTALDALLTSSAEGDLVEWYSLRHALRRTLPSLSWHIFQSDTEEADKSLMESVSASGIDMPKVATLRASEEEAPH